MRADSSVRLLLLAASLLGTCKAHLKAGCKVETLRACGEDYVPYLKGPRIPESAKQLGHACTRVKRQVPCALQFHNNCTRGLTQAAALVTVEAFAETLEAVCTTDSGLNKAYLRGVKCMNTVGDKLHACFRNLKSAVQRAVSKAPVKQAVSYICCSYHSVVDCIAKTLAPCESVAAKAFLLGIAERVMGKTLHTACGHSEKGSNTCKALPALPRLGPKEPKSDSLIELLIQAAATVGRKS